MEKKKLALGGAAACLLLVGILAGSGFQARAEKFGMVDINKTVAESKQGLRFRDDMQNAIRSRENLMKFVNDNRIVTADQARQLRDLTLKANATDKDRQDLEKLRGDITGAARKFNELNTKSNPTDADRAELSRMNNLSQSVDGLLQTWNQEFSAELETLSQRGQENLLKTAREVVKDVASKKGITLVFPSQVVVWAADDITDDAVKAMNAK